MEVSNLTKQYHGFKLDNISFALERGYIMGFIGPNGAGKTTTIKAIMNLINIDGGQIKVFGKNHRRDEKEIKQKIGFVYEDNYYYENLSIVETKRVVAPFYRYWDEEIFNHYLKEFELPPKKKIKDLSRGMKLKFSLAVAISHHAELIIMDEPTSGLDPIFRSELLDILSDVVQDENKSILFSSHITSDLDKIADYITFINKGQIVFSEDKETILGKNWIVKGGKELLKPEIKSLFTYVNENSFGFEGLTQHSEKLRHLFPDQLVLERASLEDIMLYTVRGSKHA